MSWNISALRAIQPIRIVHGRVFDDLTVRISAAAADFEVDNQGEIVFGDRSVKPFMEDWTFQRSVGVATSNKPGTLENTCPSCGAPVSLTQIGECRYCKAAVTSGKFDWVVSRIDQEDQTRRRQRRLHEHEPGRRGHRTAGGGRHCRRLAQQPALGSALRRAAANSTAPLAIICRCKNCRRFLPANRRC